MPERKPEDIYGYHDGLGERYADPGAVLAMLYRALKGNPEGVRKQANQPAPFGELRPDGTAGEADDGAMAAWRLEVIEAQDQLEAASREAFALCPFDPLNGSGITRDESLKILNDFLVWIKKKQTSTADTRTLPSTLASPPPSTSKRPQVTGLSPKRPDSVSGSTSPDCGCD